MEFCFVYVLFGALSRYWNFFNGYLTYIDRCANINTLVTSVPEPDPEPDPHVFGPPGSGSGSTSQRYGSGSGSFYHHAKIVGKTLIPYIL